MKTTPNTDPALWTIRPVFGVAGGADEVVLSAEGLNRAFSVGAQVRRGGPAEAMMALHAAGGSAHLCERHGTKMLLTEMGRRHNMSAWGVLIERDYCERWHDATGNGVRLTTAGVAAVTNGITEQARLLERCRRAAGVPTTPRAIVHTF